MKSENIIFKLWLKYAYISYVSVGFEFFLIDA